jgi:hypothetical protein
MLEKEQARQIVEASIHATSGKHVNNATEKLINFDFTDTNLSNLVKTLVADPQNGVPHFEHYLDPNIIGELDPQTVVGDLVDMVLKLSAGKLCSNPATPHPQKCCPYPSNCPQCGYKVL